MFRWCSYCQRLLGESAPFDDYRITHGVCESCVEKMDAGETFPVKGLDLFKSLFAAARAGDQPACRELVDQALAQGWRPSDAAVGLLQPALYEIGRLWEEGKVTVAEERVFTSWCERALTLLEDRAPATAGFPRVLICAVEGNAHFIGSRVTALYLRDHGVPARAVLPGLPDDRIIELCLREKPEILGLSVALESGLERVRAIAARAAELPRPPRIVVGGLAARLPQAAEFDRASTAADILAYLSK